MKKLTNLFLNFYYFITDGLPNHYSYKLEGFSKKNNITYVIYRISGNRQIFQSPLNEVFEEETYINNFPPFDIKRITLEFLAQKDELIVIKESRRMVHYKLLPLLSMIYISILISAIILSPHLITIGDFTEPGGILLFPITYIIADIISEVYGYTCIRRLIYYSLICLVLVTFSIEISIKLHPSSQVMLSTHHAYVQVFGTLPRLLAANALAILISDFANAILFNKLKAITHGKYLWLRMFGASGIGEITYTVVWIAIFFIGSENFYKISEFALENYIFKVVYASLFIPFTYIARHYLLKLERQNGVISPQ